MPRALILTEAPTAPEPIRLGLLAAGYSVIDEITEPQRLLKRASAIEPDIIVIATEAPSKHLFDALRVLYENAPCAVAVFTRDGSESNIEQAAACGVQAWETEGFSGERLPAQLAGARARFKLLRELRDALEEATGKLDVRKLAMEKKLKMGAIAEQIINTAHLLA